MTGYETLVPIQSGSFTLWASLWVSIWSRFAFAGSVLCLSANKIQLRKMTAVQGHGKTESLLCLLTNRESSPVSQAVMWRWYQWVAKKAEN